MKIIYGSLSALLAAWLLGNAWIQYQTFERVACLYDEPSTQKIGECMDPGRLEMILRKILKRESPLSGASGRTAGERPNTFLRRY